MIALDTNVLVRFLVRDDEKQASAANTLLSSLTVEEPGFICREVVVELVWVLERAYGFPRDQISDVLEHLVSTEVLVMETAGDVAQAAYRYRPGGAGFSDLMILAAAERSEALSPVHFRSESSQDKRSVMLLQD